MDKNEKKKKLPTYTAPEDIMNTMQMEENNEVVNDLNKRISETINKKNKKKREMSPERID